MSSLPRESIYSDFPLDRGATQTDIESLRQNVLVRFQSRFSALALEALSQAGIDFSSRMTATFGYVGWKKIGRHFTDIRIRFSSPLFDLPENWGAPSLDTALHEFAHVLTLGHGHDEVWKSACRLIGAKPQARGHFARPQKAISPRDYELYCLDCKTRVGWNYTKRGAEMSARRCRHEPCRRRKHRGQLICVHAGDMFGAQTADLPFECADD